jgi:hypothetical protein
MTPSNGAGDFLVMSDSLSAIPLRDLVDQIRGRPPVAEDHLPISVDGNLSAGQLYPDASDPAITWYLPTYQHHTEAGRYTTSLKWRGATDPVDGPIAHLDVELAATAPANATTTSREIDHQAVVSLAYQLPVGPATNAPPPAPDRPTPMPPTPADPSGRPLLRMEIGTLASTANGVRSCRLDLTDKADFDRLYQIMTDVNLAGRLEVLCLATVGRRTWRQILPEGIRRHPIERPDMRLATIQQLAVSPRQTATLVAVLPALLFSETTEQATFHSAEGRSRTVLDSQALVESRAATAATGIAATAATDVATPAATAATAATGIAPTAATSVQVDRLATEIDVEANPAFSRRLQFSKLAASPEASWISVDADQLARAPIDAVAVAVDQQQPVAVDQQQPVDQHQQQRVTRSAADEWLARSLAQSDVMAVTGATQAAAIPLQILIDIDGWPVLVRVSVQTTEIVDPFCFPVATNAYMFDIPGDLTPTTNEVLIPTEVTVDGEGSATFYQDSLFPDRFYYRPQAFRLSRSSVSPYRPNLVFGFVDVVASAGSNPTVQYQVQVGYKAAPWISPLLLDEIRQQAAAGTPAPHFLALVPEASHLSLRLAPDSASPPGTLTSVDRPDARVTFENGIVDQITLSPDEFKRFVASMTGGGVDGSVDATLIDATSATVPVSLSLAQTVGPIFARALRPGAAPGSWQVTVTNELESPVEISQLFGTVIAPGVVAIPPLPPADPVAPGTSVTLEYRVTPAGAVVLDIAPAMETSVQVDPATMLSALMVNQGYAAATFDLPVSLDPQYFANPAPDGRSLAAVAVDFDSGVSVLLTKDLPSGVASLRMPLLPWLLNQPDAKSYQYQVTPHWATGPDGTPGGWQIGTGDSPLAIDPNPPG